MYDNVCTFSSVLQEKAKKEIRATAKATTRATTRATRKERKAKEKVKERRGRNPDLCCGSGSKFYSMQNHKC